MILLRRAFLHLAAAAAAAAAVSRVTWAQFYPSRPVRIIVGFAAGGGYDIITRLMGQWLSERLGQSFVIEIRHPHKPSDPAMRRATEQHDELAQECVPRRKRIAAALCAAA
jgi:hypothetical protein